jgi:hypothetical protein
LGSVRRNFGYLRHKLEHGNRIGVTTTPT